MKKLLTIFLLVLVLSACSDPKNIGSYTPVYQTAIEHDPQFKDCSIKAFTDDLKRPIYAIRCPNSTVTTNARMNKVTRTVVMIDGVE